MENLFEEVLTWASSDLDYWEQATLNKILSGSQITDKDYQELLTYFLEDKSLIDKSTHRNRISFNLKQVGKEYSKKEIRLKEISNLENVNALISNQKLTFGDNLTAIYGLNGAGKSGYVRVLGSAGFTRGDREVLPDVTKEIDVDKKMCAKVKLEIDSQEFDVKYEIGSPCPELSTFYVFDSTSIKVHMVGKNTFSFSPAGLSILTELASATDVVRELVKNKIKEYERPSEFEKYFTKDSELYNMVQNINADTNYDILTERSVLLEADEKRIHELEIQIGKIGLGQHQTVIKEKKRNYANIKKLYDWLIQLETIVSENSIATINLDISNFNDLTEREKVLCIQSFQNEQLTQTGSSNWNVFMQAAYQLAKDESTSGQNYPEIGQPCIFCQQPLSGDSVDLIQKIWAFLDEKVQSSLKQIRESLQKTLIEVEQIINYFKSEDYETSFSLLSGFDETTGEKVNNQVSVCLPRINELKDSIELKKKLKGNNTIDTQASTDLNTFLEDFSSSISKLEGLDLATQIEKDEREKTNLNEKKILQGLLPDIKHHIDKCVWAKNAQSVLGSTRHITIKHNSLFDSLVRDRYIEIFTQILNSLERPLNVEIVTSGHKGESIKQIQLKAHKTAFEIANTEKVLSEGEKRAVAFSDFLTEATLDDNCNGIILDDPVTSLDNEWRQKIADLLVEESRKRQVVVFTHDLPFLYLLISNSDEKQISCQTHWISREGQDGKPGYVLLDNCPPLEQNYRSPKIAEMFLNEARAATGQKQQYLLSSGFGHLRTCYEVMVIYDLFGGVVRRFEDRVRMSSLKTLCWDNEIANEINDGFERISRYIDAHSHSDPVSVLTEPEQLNYEINAFKSLQTKLKKFKKESLEG